MIKQENWTLDGFVFVFGKEMMRNRRPVETNLEANLAESAPLLVAPSLHTSPVSKLHKKHKNTAPIARISAIEFLHRQGREEEYPRREVSRTRAENEADAYIP